MDQNATIPSPDRQTILLVDDYEEAVDAWRVYLRSCGFNVLTAGDGPTALAMARGAKPDLVILDVDLPGQSGTEVAAILRSEAATHAIPLIAATGYAKARSPGDTGGASGFDAVIVKPCDPVVLLAEIRRLLNARGEPAKSTHRYPRARER